MKLNGNGGYQIIDFEAQAPNTLDVSLFNKCLERGKPIWVNNLVVDGETYSGVGSIKKTLTSIIVAIASINIAIALSDGATTYEAQNIDVVQVDIELTPSKKQTNSDDNSKIRNYYDNGKSVIIRALVKSGDYDGYTLNHDQIRHVLLTQEGIGGEQFIDKWIGDDDGGLQFNAYFNPLTLAFGNIEVTTY